MDLGTNTGVAIGNASGSPVCHTERLGEPGDKHGPRFTQALRMTRRLIELHSPDYIVIETPIATGVVGSIDRVRLAMGLRACVFGIAHMNNVRVREYPVQTVRKHFLGKGNMKRGVAKAAAIATCKQLGWIVANDDEADACAVWDCARGQLRLAHALPANGLFHGN